MTKVRSLNRRAQGSWFFLFVISLHFLVIVIARVRSLMHFALSHIYGSPYIAPFITYQHHLKEEDYRKQLDEILDDVYRSIHS
jgi:hypothetical protein